MAKTSKRSKKFLPKLKKMKQQWAADKAVATITKRGTKKVSRDRKKQLKAGAEKDENVQKQVISQEVESDSDQDVFAGFDGKMQSLGKPESLEAIFDGMDAAELDEEEITFSSDDEEADVMNAVQAYEATGEEIDSDDENESLEQQLAAHKEELAELRKQDPAFYSMLEGEADLEDEDEEDEDDEGGDGFLEEESIGRSKKKKTAQTTVTEDMFDTLCEAAADGSGKALKKLISMFRAACHFMEEADLEEADRKGRAPYRYLIPDSTVYNEVMMFGLNNIAMLLDYQLGLTKKSKIDVHLDGGEEEAEEAEESDEESDEQSEEPEAGSKRRGVIGSGSLSDNKRAAANKQQPAADLASSAEQKSSTDLMKGKSVRLCQMKRRDTRKWKQWEAPLKSFLSNALHFLMSCPANQISMLGYGLRRFEHFLHLFAPLPAVSKMLLKFLVNTWVTGEDASRILAFLNIRALAIVAPFPFCEMCMKATYLAFVRHSKSFNRNTEPHNQLLMNCAVEVFGTDLKSAYQIAFVHIRQLASALRTAIVTKTKVAHQAVYNWSYISAIKFFAALIVRYRNSQDVQMLQYPLVQVVNGVINLIPTSRFYPLRFICIRALCEISEATSTFIPVASFLLQVFDDIVSRKKPLSKTASKPLDFDVCLKAPDAAINTRVYQEGTVEQALELLTFHFACHATSISFPELVFPTCTLLRKYTKALFSQSSQIATRVKQFLKVVDKNTEWVKQHRRNVDFSPKDQHKVERFLSEDKLKKKSPLLQYRKQQQKAKQELLESRMAQLEEELANQSGSESEEEEEEFEYESEGESEIEFE